MHFPSTPADSSLLIPPRITASRTRFQPGLSQRNVSTDNNRRFPTSPTGDECDPPGRRHMKVYCYCAGGSDDSIPPFTFIHLPMRRRIQSCRDARPRVLWTVHTMHARRCLAWSGGHGRGGIEIGQRTTETESGQPFLNTIRTKWVPVLGERLQSTRISATLGRNPIGRQRDASCPPYRSRAPSVRHNAASPPSGRPRPRCQSPRLFVT